MEQEQRAQTRLGGEGRTREPSWGWGRQGYSRTLIRSAPKEIKYRDQPFLHGCVLPLYL